MDRTEQSAERQRREQRQARAARAYDQWERGEIAGVLLLWDDQGRAHIKKLPEVIEE